MITASAQAESTGRPIQVTAATDEENTLTANPDGTFTQDTSATPIRVQQSGAWVPLNATLQQNSDGTWSTGATTASLVLSGGGPAGSTLASMDDDGQSLAFTWPTTLPAPTVTGDTALYSGILPGVDLQVTANDQGGFTDLVVIDTPTAAQNPALASLTMGTTASSGLTLSTDAAGDISATEANGDLVYQSPAPVMYDSGTTSPAESSPSAAASPGIEPSPASSSSTDASPSASPSGVSAQARTAAARGLTAQDSTPTTAPSATVDPSATTTPAATPSPEDTTPAPSAGSTSDPVAVSVSADSITLTPDKALLDSPTAVFPIVIDPSYTPQPISHQTGLSHYTYIQQGCSTATNEDANNTYDQYGIGVGYQGYATCDGIERSIYEFNIGSWIDNDQIKSATLNVDETYIASDGCDPATVSAWSVPEISSSTDWSNFSGASASELDSQSIGGADRSGCAGDTATAFNVAGALSSTSNGIVDIELRGNESDETLYKRFAKTANISFTYNTTPNMPTGTTTSPPPVSPSSQGCTTTASDWGWLPTGGSGGYVTLSAVVSDADGEWGQDVEGRFSLHDTTAGTVPIVLGQDSGNLYSGVTSTDDAGWIASGKTVTKRIPTADLIDGHTYGWYVAGWDGFTQSATTPACYFKYDSSAPNGLEAGGVSATGGKCVVGSTLAQGAQSSVVLTATDAESGLAHFHYAWQDGSTLAAGGGVPLTPSSSATLTFTPTSWGSYTLWFDATDNAGNQSGAACYTFNVTANNTVNSTPGDIDGVADANGDYHPDLTSADAEGNLDMWSTTTPNAPGTDISPAGNGPDANGSWAGALYGHRLPAIKGAHPVDDLWALSNDRQTMYLYQNTLNTPGSTGTAPYYTSSRRVSITPCDGGTYPCNGHALNWSNVNQVLAVGDMNDDGLSDVITEEAGGNLWFFPGTGSQHLGTPQLLGTWAPWDNWTFIAPGNTAGDGGVAQLWARDNSTGDIYAYTVTDTDDSVGIVQNPTPIGTGLPASAYPQIMSDGDLNGDGLPDLMATTSDGSLLQITNTGTAAAPAFNSSPSTANPGPAQLQGPGWATVTTAIESNPAPLSASGPVTLTPQGGTLCMDDNEANQAAGTLIWDLACNGTAAQQWTFQSDGSIHAQKSNACLTATTGNGASVALQTCATGNTLQQWSIQSDDSLQNAGANNGSGSPVCLSDPAASTTPETDLITWTCKYDSTQSFGLPGTGPTAEWELNDKAGSTIAADTAAQDPATVDGTITFGATGPTTTASAANFNGSSTLDAHAAVNTTQSYSVSAWVKLGTLTGQQWALAEGDTNHAALYLGYNGTNWQFMTTTSDTAATTYAFAAGGPTPTLNTWTHLIGTYDATAGTLTLYVNGTPAATAANTTPVAGGNLTIGGALCTATGSTSYEDLTGSVANVQTYNRALNARQALNLYDSGTTTN